MVGTYSKKKINRPNQKISQLEATDPQTVKKTQNQTDLNIEEISKEKGLDQ